MIPYKLPFRLKPEYLTLQNEQNSTQTHQLILPWLKLFLVILANMSCSSRDDLWKVTTVLLKIGPKKDKNPSHATTTWTATDGDTGDLRGKPWAVLIFLSKGMWKKERHLHLSSLYLLGELDLKQCCARCPELQTAHVMLLKETVKSPKIWSRLCS